MSDCPHRFPFVQLTADVVVSGKFLKSPAGCVKVDRHSDCIFCGPRVERITYCPQSNPKVGTPFKGQQIFYPLAEQVECMLKDQGSV